MGRRVARRYVSWRHAIGERAALTALEVVPHDLGVVPDPVATAEGVDEPLAARKQLQIACRLAGFRRHDQLQLSAPRGSRQEARINARLLELLGRLAIRNYVQ